MPDPVRAPDLAHSPHPVLAISAETVAAVEAEAARAYRKHGERSILNPAMPDAVRLPVLVEEVGEVAKAMLENADPADLRAELIQVAAIALTWLEALRTSDGAERLRYNPANSPPYQVPGPRREAPFAGPATRPPSCP
ncbi:hypothetical protein I7331_08000 [Frankia sp. AgB1.8]|nr:hypothetical protein [Frankia sp. AgB1.8]